MVPKQPTNQPTDRRAGHNQPTNKLRRVSENNRKLKKRFRFQLSPCEKQSCSLLCHCKAARNTLTDTQVPQTSKTRPHARNNWGTWRGHNNQLPLMTAKFHSMNPSVSVRDRAILKIPRSSSRPSRLLNYANLRELNAVSAKCSG